MRAAASSPSRRRRRSSTSGVARPPRRPPSRWRLVTDIGSLNDRGFNQLAVRRAAACREASSESTDALYVDEAGPTDSPNLLAREPVPANLIFGVGFLMTTARSRPWRRSSRRPSTRDRRRAGRHVRATMPTLQERRHAELQGISSPSKRPAISSATSPRSRSEGRAWQRSSRRRRHTRCRRSCATSPATRRARRRRTRASPCSPTTRNDLTFADQDEVQGHRARRRSPRARDVDLPGRRRLRPRRPRRGEGEAGDLGHRRRRRPGLPRQPHADERAEEGRRAVFDAITNLQADRPVRRAATKLLFNAAERRRRPRHRSTTASRQAFTAKTNAIEQQIATGKIKPPKARRTRTARRPVRRGRARARPRRLRRSAMRTDGRRGSRPRAPRDHEALPGHRRERPHRPRPPARRGARSAGRERRRQVDADERPLRALRTTRARSSSTASRSTSRRRRTRSTRGIGMVHQHFMLIPVMTVGGEHRARRTSRRERRDPARLRAPRASASASSPRRSGSQIDPDALIADITVGQQQRVEILKALYRSADILILDEPTAVLTPQEATRAVRDPPHLLKAEGMSIIFISHKLNEVLEIADRITRAPPRQEGRHRARRGRDGGRASRG